MSADNDSAPVCMTPRCGRPKPNKRGLCLRCYRAYQRLVQSKDTTDDEAVRLGLIKPRSGDAAFIAALRDARKERTQ